MSALQLRPGQLDLLGGCPPCQGFSTLRTKNGGRRVRDSQNDLIFEFQRLVIGLRPKHVMLENVPGLLADTRLAQFSQSLGEAGYAIRAGIQNAVDFGVPQRRRRLVFIASLGSSAPSAIPGSKRKTVRDTICSLPAAGRSGDPLHDLPESRSEEVKLRIRQIPKDGGSRSALPRSHQLPCHRRSDGFTDVYGRMAWDQPAPTITTGCFNPSKGRFLHPVANRAITMREAAMLQSFPRSYKFPKELGKVKLAQMIGNALPPAFVRAHARAIRSQLVQ